MAPNSHILTILRPSLLSSVWEDQCSYKPFDGICYGLGQDIVKLECSGGLGLPYNNNGYGDLGNRTY